MGWEHFCSAGPSGLPEGHRICALCIEGAVLKKSF